ncbi:MAG TPA: COX15/CtaA family protein [Opitutaceae bacterium]
MSASPSSSRSAHYKPALAWFAAGGAAWVFVLVTLGAFTTSIGAGMAFPDWPLSNGSINPEGWLTDIAMFAEHSHRLSGATMGFITIGLAVWLWRSESRAWLRRLGWWALFIVIVQGLIGGKRVLLDATHLPGFDMSLGQILRIPHGILAQVFVCMLFAIAAGLSKPWIERKSSSELPNRIRQLAILSTGLILAQLVIAATMRHNYAGLAIPTFPLTPEGGLIPSTWDFRVGIHFAHRAMALVITVVLVWLAVEIWRAKTTDGIKLAAATITALLVIQVSLGAAAIWTMRNAYYTTAHVIVGASLMAATFSLTWWAHRDRIERLKPNPAPAGHPRLETVGA